MTAQLTATTVDSVMTANPVAVSPWTPFKDILELLADRNIGAVPVVSATGIIVGVVSEADLLRGRQHRTRRRRHRGWPHDTGRLTAGELMTTRAATVPADTTLADAAAMLAEHGTRRLYVVDDGRLVGVVARRDLLSRYVRPDKEIRAEIEHEILDRAPSVRVSVNGGVVLLTGRLPWRSDIDTVVARAAEVPGVIDVKNRLVSLDVGRLSG